MKYLKNDAAYLLLEDGLFFEGRAIGRRGTTTGELCFNTSMTVGLNASNFSSGKENVIGFFLSKKCRDSSLVPEVQFPGTPQNQVVVAFSSKFSDDG